MSDEITSRNYTKLWNDYQEGLRYLERKELTRKWEECENFDEGNQWPAATPRTKNLPRPVINFCSMIKENKKSGILSSNVKLVFRATENFGSSAEISQEGSDIFTKFAENVLHDLDQASLDNEAIDNSTKIGNAIYHYYWDSQISGGLNTPFVGSLRGEVLHPKNVVFANPAERDEQKQPWIIIATTENLESVRDRAKKNGITNWQDIVADNENKDEEYSDKSVCTLLTRYSRTKGKVVWEQATKNAPVQTPILWEPQSENVKFENMDLEEVNEPDIAKTNGYFTKQLYPIVVSSHKYRKNCIYGIGEIEQIIPNQKALNFQIAMMLLSVQQTAWPKVLEKATAKITQEITNTPGERIIDNTPGDSWGIKYMDTPNFNPQAMQIANTLLDLTRTATQSSEVTTGEVMGANMAASAVIALQNQAKKPIEMLQKSFYRTYQKIGKVLEQYFKYYYTDNRLFGYEEDGQTFAVPMNGEKYKNVDFNLLIDAGSSGMYSESLEISILENLKANGDIDFDTYIDLYPDTVMTFKQKLKKIREKQLLEQQQLMEQQMINQQIGMQNVPMQNQGIMTQ